MRPPAPKSHSTKLVRSPEMIGCAVCGIVPRWIIAVPDLNVSDVTSPETGSRKSTVEPVNSSPGRFALMLSVTDDASVCGRIEVSVSGR